MTTDTENTPNLFELVGDKTTISYSTTTLDGKPRLTYAGPHGEFSLAADEIATMETALGTEVTVTLEATADLEQVTFTLILPGQLGNAAFTTLGIVTHNPTTIGGPAGAGPQTYEVVHLQGQARFVIS